MSPRRDLDGEMSPHPIDDGTAERLLAGGLAPEDAPAGYRALAEVLRAAQTPGTAEELAGEATLVAAMAEVVRSVPGIRHTSPRRNKVLTNALAAKLAAGLAAATVLGGTAAAAATGSLPGPAQNAASSALSHVGVHVPKGGPNAHANGHATNHGAGAATKSTEPMPQSSWVGLCQAYLAHQTSTTNANQGNWQNATAFKRLAATAAANGGSSTDVGAWCSGQLKAAQTNGATTTEGTEASDTNQGQNQGSDHSQAANHRPGGTADTQTTSSEPSTTEAGSGSHGRPTSAGTNTDSSTSSTGSSTSTSEDGGSQSSGGAPQHP